MVKNLRKPQLFIFSPTVILEKEENELKWSSIKLSEIQQKQNRLEASVYGIEGKKAWYLVLNSNYPQKTLVGTNGFATAYHRPRFKRIFISQSEFPIYQPSQIAEIFPKPNKYISSRTKTDIEQLKVTKNQILMTCSGTIGKITFVSKTLDNKIFSHDVLRIRANNDMDNGYIYAFLKTKIGQLLLSTNNYGAVIQHIEPEHLQQIPIPDPPDEMKQKIHVKIIKSFDLRDESNELIEKAEKLLIEELKLPPIEAFKPKYYRNIEGLKTFNVKQSNFDNRFDASYHIPIVDEILKHLNRHAEEVVTLGDKRISKNILLPGRFKRVYVEEGKGIAFIGSKQILELNPSNKKYLSTTYHNKRIKEQLILVHNSIILSCSGTIGKVAIVPKHWSDWSASQHVLRIFPIDDSLAGYIYIWLNSVYGLKLINRFTYGSVVDEIDTSHVSKVQIPILKNQEIQNEINDLVLKANELRYEAFLLEQDAIKIVNEEILYVNSNY